MTDEAPPPLPDGYNAQDRYRDFRRVLADTEDGQRVLRQILEWCRIRRVMPPVAPLDPYLLAYHEGERHIGVNILLVMEREPKERPTQQAKRVR